MNGKGFFSFEKLTFFSIDLPSKQIITYLPTQSNKIITNILNDCIEKWIWNIWSSQWPDLGVQNGCVWFYFNPRPTKTQVFIFKPGEQKHLIDPTWETDSE